MSILFNGKVLVAHHHPGKTLYLLVTFNGAYQEADAETVYLMRDIVERDGISCIGINHRVRNLYVSDEIDEIAAKVRAIRAPGQKLIMVGQSGGGYAAIKYATKFGADHVLSFSPMYSLNEQDLEIDPGDEQTPRILRASIRYHRIPSEAVQPGMRPTVADCPLPALIVYDTHNYNDSYAANRYARHFPDIRFLRAPYMGHTVFHPIRDSGFMSELLGRIAREDDVGARGMLHRLVRSNPDAIGELVSRLARWKPDMALLALRSRRVQENLKPEFRRRHSFNNVLAYNFVRLNHRAAAQEHLASIHPDRLSPPAAGTDPAAATPASSAPVPGLHLVLNFHGDILGYDASRSEARFSSDTLHLGGAVPLLLDTRSEPPRFVLSLREGEREIVVGRTDDAPAAIELGTAGALITLRRGGMFMRGDQGSVPRFAAEHALEWERFALLPIVEPASLHRHTSMNWFDQATMMMDLDPATPPDATPRRKPVRSMLRRLFN